MPAPSHVAHVIELLRSEEPLAQYAARHGLDEAQLRAWKDAYLAGAASTLTSSRRRWSYGVMGALVTVAALVPAQVLAGNCAAVVPAPLKTMCADEPALAAEINANFKVLADHLIGRTGSIDAGASTQDIRQRATAVWYADDGTFNLSANQVQLQNLANDSSGNALSAGGGDTLIVNEGNAFGGGTRIDGPTYVPGGFFGAIGFNGLVNVAAGARFYGAEARFQGFPPQVEPGFAMNQCQWVGAQDNQHWGTMSEAVCPSGWFVNGVRCRTNGQSETPSYTTFCQSFCCHP